ncbi:TolC family protein, partial [Hydrogenophaga sp.]
MTAPHAPDSRRSRPFSMSRLAVAIGWGLSAATGAQAQSLVELYEAARGFDATYLSARSQYEANLFRAEQAKAGLLPEVGLGAAASWARREINGGADTSSNSQSATLSASQPLYRPVNKLNNDQA